jgi:hypothetical protein
VGAAASTPQSVQESRCEREASLAELRAWLAKTA